MNPFSQAAITFTSQNCGAGKFERITKILLFSLCLTCIVGLTFSACLLIFGNGLLGIYTSSPDVIQQGMVRLSTIIMTYVLCGIMEVFAGSIRGMGYSLTPMLITIAGVCGIRLVWIWTVFPMQNTIESLYVSYPISWVATIALYVVFYMYYLRKIKRTLKC
jgi:Na+-driven multidrug efflux pump